MKKFGGVIALNEVDLVVPRGAIIGLIGPNGAGKTTFFNAVTGLSRPDSGQITFEGQSLVGLRPNAIVARGIARTFQSIRLFPYMTVLENVLVGENCRLTSSVLGSVLRPPSVVAEEAQARAPGPRAARHSSVSPTRATIWPATCPTATSAAWRSLARSPPSRGCCCSTSRRPA